MRFAALPGVDAAHRRPLEAPIPAPLTVEDLARTPSWPREQVQALGGACRGALLRDWAAHLRRDFGDSAVRAVREALDLDPRTLPDAPERKAWFPVALQLTLTRTIAERYTGGDLLALEPLLLEAGRSARDRAIAWAMATVGPEVVLRHADTLHRWLYDRGAVTPTVHRNMARIEWRGAEFFGEPTWRLLQCFGLRATVGLLKRELDGLTAFDLGTDAFAVELRWHR